MNRQSSGHAFSAGCGSARNGSWIQRTNEWKAVLWVVLALLLPALTGCQKPAPAPAAGAANKTVIQSPPPPKTYAERTQDRLVVIKDRLQLLKDQAAPLRGPSMRMATVRIRSIEVAIHAADREAGQLRRHETPPVEQAAINQQLAQIEHDIEATSQAIANTQGRR